MEKRIRERLEEIKRRRSSQQSRPAAENRIRRLDPGIESFVRPFLLFFARRLDPMAASPNTFVSDPVTVRDVQPDQVEHLLKFQKWARKITSILDLDELIGRLSMTSPPPFSAWKPPFICMTKSAANWRWPAFMAAPFTTRDRRLKVGKEGMVGYVAVHRTDALCARCTPRPVLRGLRGVHALGSRHPSCWWMDSWSEYFRLRIRNSMPLPATTCDGCRRCASTSRSR